MKEEKYILEQFDLGSDRINASNVEDGVFFEKVAFYASQIDTPSVDVSSAWNDFSAKHLKTKTKVRTLNFNMMYRVAAVLVVALVTSWFLFFNSEQIHTELAETKTFLLPDQSEVILNAHSSVRYKKRKWKKKRSLTLDGEAFFKAEKGQTFTVLTSQGTVEVLGTQFNVKERPDYFEVECYEGRVAVYYNNNEIELSPGQSIRLVNGIEQDRIEFNTNTPSWLNEESSFVEVGLNQVLDELERQYDIELETSTIELDRIFTGSFTHTNLETALKSITIPLGLRYQVNAKNVTLFDNDEH